MNTLIELEKEIQQSYALQEPRPEFLNNLAGKISTSKEPAVRTKPFPRLAWAIIGLLGIVLITVLAIGPTKVLAQLQNWLGLHPDLGLIQPDTQLRVLKEPAIQTLDGITIEVYDGTLSAEKSFIYLSVTGVPASAYPHNENVSGCLTPQYLESKDGRIYQAYGDSEYEVIPSDVNELELVIPCIHNTLPGTTPENWRIPLEFVQSEQPLKLTPVYIFPTETPVANKASIVVSHSLLQDDNLILGGYIRNLDEKYRNLIGGLEVYDANGKPVPFIHDQTQRSLANTLSNRLGFWIIRLNPEGLTFPLEIRNSYLEVSQPIEDEKASLSVYLPDEYPRHDLIFEQTFEIAGETVELYFLRIQPSQFGGYEYAFYFKDHPIIKKLEVSSKGTSRSNSGTSFGSEEMHGKLVFMSGFWMEEGSLHGDVKIDISSPVKVLKTETLVYLFTPPADLLIELSNMSQ